MPLPRAALQLGLQLIQEKLGQVMGDPGFSALDFQQPLMLERPLGNSKPAHTAKIKPPKVVNTR